MGDRCVPGPRWALAWLLLAAFLAGSCDGQNQTYGQAVWAGDPANSFWKTHFASTGTAAQFTAVASRPAGAAVYVAAIASALSTSDTLSATNGNGAWPCGGACTAPHGILYVFEGATGTLKSSYVLATDGTMQDLMYSLVAAAGSSASQDAIYVTGATAGAFHGVNAGGLDVFLAKFTCDTITFTLTKDWVRQIGSPAADVGTHLAVDAAGSNVYVTGKTSGLLPSSGGAYLGGTDMFLLKYSSAGVLMWASQLKSNAAEIPNTNQDDWGIRVRSHCPSWFWNIAAAFRG